MRRKYYKFMLAEEEDNILYFELPYKLIHLFLNEKKWLHANPSIYSKNSSYLQNYIIETEEFINNYKKIFDILIDKNYKAGLIIKGNKGAGKTFFQNAFLNKKTRILNKNNITWIRIDITKIYYSKDRLLNISLQDYLKAQLVFVYLRYSNCKRLKERLGDIAIDCDMVFKSIDKKILKSKILKRINSKEKERCYEYVKNIVCESNYSDGISAKPFKDTLTDIFYSEIINILKENGSSIILFIDGLDNVDYDSIYLDSVVSQLYKFIESIINEKNSIFKNIILTMRSEAFQHIQYKIDKKTLEYFKFTDSKYGDENKIIKIKPISLKKYINHLDEFDKSIECNKVKHLDFIKELKKIINEDKCYKEFKTLHILKKKYKINLLRLLFCSLKNNNNGYKIFIEFKKYFKDLGFFVKKALIAKEVLRKEDDFDILNDFFANDFRELLLLALESFIYIREYISFKKISLSIDEFLKIQDNYLFVMEALFKNGNIYTPTIQDKKYSVPYRNINFINILNPMFSNISEYHPVINLYFLNYLKKERNEEEIYRFLKNIDNINKSEAENILKTFVEYNYIRFKNKNFVATTKGRLIFEYSFRDINVIQTMIFSGLFEKEYLEYFDTYGKRWEKYITETLKNSAVFLTWLEDNIERYNKIVDRELQIDFKKNKKYLEKDFMRFMLKAQEFGVADEVFFDDNTKYSMKFKITLNMYLNDFVIIKRKINKIDIKNFNKFFNFLNEREKIFLLKWYFRYKPEEIMSNYFLHKFIFGNFSEKDYENRMNKIEKTKGSFEEYSILLKKLKENFNNNH